MGRPDLVTSIDSARRLAVTKQHLAGPFPRRASREALVTVVHDLGYVQWDPISVVAPSHLLAFWSRIGNFRLPDLERLLYRDKKLFQHWSHAASIVSTEDYPIHYSLMRRYPESFSDSWGYWKRSARRWLPAHRGLRQRILRELRRRGPLRMGQFLDHERSKKREGGWSPASDVAQMLTHLQMSGEVMNVGHDGAQNLWGLSENFLPSWVEKKVLPVDEVEREGAERSIRALGTASASEINFYFLRGRYLNLKRALNELEEASVIHRVRVTGFVGAGQRYIHERDRSLLESMDTDAWEPRMSMLSPFDNLICNSTYTQRLFGFHHAIELYKPEAQRKFGYYVLPILWGDRFIGRVDPRFDKGSETLVVSSVHAEPGAPTDIGVSREVGETIARLGDFVGAKEVRYSKKVPPAWKKSLR